MRKLLFIPILFIAVLSGNAQDTKKENRHSKHRTSTQMSPEQRAKLKTKRLTDQLSLTKEQQEKVYQLSLKQAALHAEQSKKRHELAKLMREENQKNRQEIEKLLNSEQQKKWTELKSQQMELRKKRRDSLKRDFKSKGGMVKKRDSIQSRKPMDKIKPVQNNN